MSPECRIYRYGLYDVQPSAVTCMRYNAKLACLAVARANGAIGGVENLGRLTHKGIHVVNSTQPFDVFRYKFEIHGGAYKHMASFHGLIAKILNSMHRDLETLWESVLGPVSVYSLWRGKTHRRFGVDKSRTTYFIRHWRIYNTVWHYAMHGMQYILYNNWIQYTLMYSFLWLKFYFY